MKVKRAQRSYANFKDRHTLGPLGGTGWQGAVRFVLQGTLAAYLNPWRLYAARVLSPARLKKKTYLSKQLRHAFVDGLSLKTAWVRVPHGPLIGWVKNSAYGPITIEYTKPPNSMRPPLIYTEENLKKQVF